MAPFSNERLQWIEGRLFCLARMANELSQRSMTYEVKLRVEGASHIARNVFNEIQAERMQLMVERQVIETYNQEQYQAAPKHS
jgi:hypothetical protein